MPTFKEVAEYWLEENSTDKIDFDLVYQNIGNIDIKSVTSDELQKFFYNLYDNVKLRGVVFTSYEKVIGDIFQFAFNRGYISQVPKIERRNAPPPNLFHQPDSSAMQLLLSHEDCTPAGTILRLAWYCGLLRNEITYLLWDQVDFEQRQILLTDRKVPLNDEMISYLERLYKQNSRLSKHVLISQRKTAPMAEQSVSALARRVLDRYGQSDVRLNDLRIDFIVRALKENNWEYVSHISGVDLPALQQHYLPYVGSDDVIRSEEKTEITQIVREQLKDFIEKEKTSMVGLSIRFVWQMGIPISVLPFLAWEVIDFDNSVAIFSDRTVSIPDDFLTILRETKKARGAEYQN
ncbi:MAG: tyrosine-type recombinase/integrase, partial [Enterococcus lemanii]